jgi:SNF2 family DNA or RNA helicase
MSSRLFLDNDHLVLDFPFDSFRVAEVKLLDGARWDKVHRLWRVPISSIDAARQFAFKYDFEVTPEVLKFTLPERTGSPNRGVYEQKGDLYASFRYDPVMIRSVKQIPSITWDKKSAAWKAPMASINEVIKWAEAFTQPIEQQVYDRAVIINSQLSELRDASRASSAEIDIPGLLAELLPYQKAGVVYASRARRVFVADEMGLGKTLQAIATLEHLNQSAPCYPAVVMCPPNLVLNWKSEYSKWLPTRKVACVLAGKGEKNFPEDGAYDVIVVGYSNINYWKENLLKHKSYVLDESHYCKTPTAQRTKSAKKIVASAPTGAPVLLLTGTPVTNRPAEYASQLDILGRLKDFGGLWGFYRRYCAAFRDSWGVWHLDGASHLDELNDRLRGLCYIRRTKDQVLKELPPVFHQPLVIQGTAPEMLEYKKAEADIVEYLVERAKVLASELGQSPRSAAVRARIRAESSQSLVRLSVLRRLAAKAKMEALGEWMNDKLPNNKVVVAAHHRDVVDEISTKYGGLKIQGGMEVADVEAAKKEFQTNNDAKVITLSIQAAKTGHTLTAAQDVVFLELPWTPADLDQTYSRLHRIGQTGSVTSTYLLCAGTIDEDIYNLIQQKRKVVNAAVDGEAPASDHDVATELVLGLISKGLE